MQLSIAGQYNWSKDKDLERIRLWLEKYKVQQESKDLILC